MKRGTDRGILTGMIIILILLSSGGCVKTETWGDEYFKVGTEYKVETGLSFRIDSLHDYRCPKDVMCFWSGDVDLYFSILHNNTRTDTLIYFWTRGNNPFVLAGKQWHVTEVWPYPDTQHHVDQSSLRVKIVITDE